MNWLVECPACKKMLILSDGKTDTPKTAKPGEIPVHYMSGDFEAMDVTGDVPSARATSGSMWKCGGSGGAAEKVMGYSGDPPEKKEEEVSKEESSSKEAHPAAHSAAAPHSESKEAHHEPSHAAGKSPKK